MHDCLKCGQACDCDGEDMWNPTPRYCRCPCSEDEELEDEEALGAQMLQDLEWEKYQEAMKAKKNNPAKEQEE